MPAPDVNAMRSKFFQGRRDDVNRNANAAGQAQSDAITRRMAALGQGAGSGAAIGAQIKAGEAVENQRRAAMGDVDAAEQGAMMQSAEAQLGREFQGGLADKDAAMKREFFNQEHALANKNFGLAEKQFELDKETTEFNKEMARQEMGRENPGMLGMGGFLGTGLGGKRGWLGTGLGGENGLFGSGFLGSGGIFGSGGGGCFLTTAAVGAMGMADDSWVLEAARAFRDGYMASDHKRAMEIVEYYETAPAIVEAISAKEDAAAIWKRLFWKDIIPFVDAAKNQENEKAHALYLALIQKAKELAGV